MKSYDGTDLVYADILDSFSGLEVNWKQLILKVVNILT